MAVFHCYRGDVSNIAIDKPNSFALTDVAGNNWVCHEEPGDSMEPNMNDVLDFWMAQGTPHQQGLSEEGSELHGLICELHELPAKLAESKPLMDSSD